MPLGPPLLLALPAINHQSLSEKGFIAEEIKKLDAAVGTAFEIGFVFNVYTLVKNAATPGIQA